jgi:hypothetical protein
MAMLGDTPDRRMPVIDTANVSAAAPPEVAAAPELDSAFFGRMLAFFVRAQLLPQPASTNTATTKGK